MRQGAEGRGQAYDGRHSYQRTFCWGDWQRIHSQELSTGEGQHQAAAVHHPAQQLQAGGWVVASAKQSKGDWAGGGPQRSCSSARGGVLCRQATACPWPPKALQECCTGRAQG